MYIDTHAHLTFPEFQPDLPAVIERAKAAKIETIVNIALDEAAIHASLKLAEAYPGYIYTALGLHPHDAKEWQMGTYEKFKDFAKNKSVVAIGEMGLDYHYTLSPVETQKEVFRQQLRLAQELNLPAIIHSREATKDTLVIIHEENQGKLKGVLHCFSGDPELAKKALDIGLMISFTGNITFPKAEIIRQAAKDIPLENIMIETDCPFMAPQGKRGQRNEPAYVISVAEKIAEIKGLSLDEAALRTSRNAHRFFNI